MKPRSYILKKKKKHVAAKALSGRMYYPASLNDHAVTPKKWGYDRAPLEISKAYTEIWAVVFMRAQVAETVS